MANDWMSTKEVMRLFGVGSTTIKRWSDDGTLPSRRTVGGHRRFSRDAVNRLLSQKSTVEPGNLEGRWNNLLRDENDISTIRGELDRLRGQIGDWFNVADFLDDVVRGLWDSRAGDDELAAANLIAAGRLGLALSETSRSVTVDEGAPVSLLATFGGPHVVHRVALADICVRSANMEVQRAEARMVAADLAARLASISQELVMLCASDECAGCDLFTSTAQELSAACKQQGVPLVICTEGKPPHDVDYGVYSRSFRDLGNVLQRLN